MYPNPFDRKHSTIRQVIDKLLHPDFGQGGGRCKPSQVKTALHRHDSDGSTASSRSEKASTTLRPFARKVR